MCEVDCWSSSWPDTVNLYTLVHRYPHVINYRRQTHSPHLLSFEMTRLLLHLPAKDLFIYSFFIHTLSHSWASLRNFRKPSLSVVLKTLDIDVVRITVLGRPKVCWKCGQTGHVKSECAWKKVGGFASLFKAAENIGMMEQDDEENEEEDDSPPPHDERLGFNSIQFNILYFDCIQRTPWSSLNRYKTTY